MMLTILPVLGIPSEACVKSAYIDRSPQLLSGEDWVSIVLK
jgi:hypothetical protein